MVLCPQCNGSLQLIFVDFLFFWFFSYIIYCILYCKYKTIKFSEEKETTFCGLDQSISFCCNNKGFPKESSSEWKYLVKNELRLEINTLWTKYIKFETSNNMSCSDCIKDYHEELLQKWLLPQLIRLKGILLWLAKDFMLWHSQKNSKTFETKCLRVDYVKFVEGSLWNIWSDMVCLCTNFTYSTLEYFVPCKINPKLCKTCVDKTTNQIDKTTVDS